MSGMFTDYSLEKRYVAAMEAQASALTRIGKALEKLAAKETPAPVVKLTVEAES